MRINVFHHVVPEPDIVAALNGLRDEVRQLFDMVTEIRMRDEVPQEIADAIGGVAQNLDNNFTQEP